MTAAESTNQNFFSTTLTSTFGPTDTTLSLDDLGTLAPGPAYFIIDPESATKKEIVYADGTWTASAAVLSAADSDHRGLPGSAILGSGQSHNPGTLVTVAPLAQHIEDVHDRIDVHTHDGTTADSAVDHGDLTGLVNGGADHADVPLLDGTRAFTGAVEFPNGTNLLPSITFTTDTDTGLFWNGTNGLGVTAGGTEVVTFSGGVSNFVGNVAATGAGIFTTYLQGSFLQVDDDGSAAEPSLTFTNDGNTGIYRAASGRINFTSDGNNVGFFKAEPLGSEAGNTEDRLHLGNGLTEWIGYDPTANVGRITVASANVLRWSANGTEVLAADGSAADPSYSFSGDGNTGLFRPTADVVALSTGGIEGVRVQADQWFRATAHGFRAQPESAALPSYGFDGDADTGMYRHANNTLGFAGGGVSLLRFDASNFVVESSQIRAQSGSASAPGYSFEASSTTGMYRDGSANLCFTRSGTEIVRSSNTDWVFEVPRVLVQLGSASVPGLAFEGDSDTGIFRSTTNQFAIACAGVQEFTLGTAGLLIPNVYNSTTGSSANVHVDSSGSLKRSTSSARYKRNVTPRAAAQDNRPLLDLTPSEFDAMTGNPERGVPLEPTGERLFGLIAEDVAEKFPMAAIYDESGQPDAIDWNAITAALISLVKDHEARLDAAGI